MSLLSSGQPCDYSLNFSGQHSFVVCGPGSYYNDKSALTVEAWVNLRNPFLIQKIVGNTDSANYSGFSLGVQNNRLFCQIIDSTGTTQGFVAGPVPANTWTHLAFSYQRAGRCKGYINGIQIISFPATPFPIGNSGITDLVIGAAASNQYLYGVDGLIDEVRIYNYPRTTAEIREDMRLGLPGPAPGLIGYWRFGEGFGATTQDLSLGNHPGLLSGTLLPTWLPAEGPYGAGTSELASVNGPLDFVNQGVRIDTTSAAIADTFVVSEIDCPPNVLPTGSNSYTQGYWIIDQYDSTAGLRYDLTFSLDSGSVDTSDAITPGNFTLYRRDLFSVGPWNAITTGASASTTFSAVTFLGVDRPGQYMIGCIGNSLLGSNELAREFTVYPVPADQSIVLKGVQLAGDETLFLKDMQGSSHPCVYSLSGEHSIRISTGELLDGCYLLYVPANSRMAVEKIVLMHR
ncbi:MAG: LamG domain-containing protein [Bacteroidota bacterium]